MQAELGDVVYVELPDIGKSFSAGETFGVVESVKVTQHAQQHACYAYLSPFKSEVS
jgi:glycine cleavage system H lipoate-binding protein